MQPNTSLFRSQALQAQRQKQFGDILLIRPLSLSLLTGLVAASILTLIAFFIWGSYTQRSNVLGQLQSTPGVVKIYAPQTGVILEKHVVEGQAVERGQILYVLSSDRHSSTQGNTQENISQQLNLRQRSLQSELDKYTHLHHDERDATVRRLETLQAELSNLGDQIKSQTLRVRLAAENQTRYRDLFSKSYISREMLQQKEIDVMDQQHQLQNLEREHIRLTREQSTQRHELSTLPLKQENRQAETERRLIQLKQELAESEAKRRLVIVAAEAGTATAIVAEQGQTVDSSIPLLQIVPRDAVLYAQLYAPSRAIGFIKPGDTVLLRYQAYPYQKFGHVTGNVESISKTAMTSAEIKLPGANGMAGGNNEQLYRITVKLAQQTIDVYGKAQPLQIGMALEADILQEKRKLYEWTLAPFFALSGKMRS